jgi:hypothetical protein
MGGIAKKSQNPTAKIPKRTIKGTKQATYRSRNGAAYNKSQVQPGSIIFCIAGNE